MLRDDVRDGSGLDAGELRAEAVVASEPVCEVRARVLAVEEEVVGLLEDGAVPIRGAEEDGDAVTTSNFT